MPLFLLRIRHDTLNIEPAKGIDYLAAREVHVTEGSLSYLLIPFAFTVACGQSKFCYGAIRLIIKASTGYLLNECLVFRNLQVDCLSTAVVFFQCMLSGLDTTARFSKHSLALTSS